MVPKYTILKRRDGLGGQLITLSFLVNFVKRFDLEAICDIRTFPYFLGSNKSFLSEYRPQDLIDFHPRIIYEFDHIDSMLPDEIFDWCRPVVQLEIIEWATGNKSNSNLNEVMHNAWKYITSTRDELEHTSQRELPMRVKDRALIEKYKPLVQNSITVHARLGNGEQGMLTGIDNSSSIIKRHDQVNRLSTNPDKFISVMKTCHSNCKFFICTDTLSFFERCRDVFGDRVYCTDRDWLPPGWGPGHDISFKPYPEKIKQEWKNKRSNPWELLCADLTDMELMCESKHIIHNHSQFNYFARETQGSTIIE